MFINVTLRQLEAFVAVAEQASYVKAARRLGLSQPALTANVLRLEELLGVRLLDRSTRVVALTDAGDEFLAAIRRVLTDLAGAIGDMRGLGERRRGRAVLACLPSVATRLVVPAMREFLCRYRGVAVRIFDGDATSVARRVRMREADFGISSAPEPNQGLEFTPLLRDRCCAVCAANHPLASLRRVRLADLAGYPFLALGPTTGARRILDQAAARADLRLDIVCEIGQLSTLCGMIETGVGVSVLPEACLPRRAKGGIVALPLVEPVVERDLGLVTIKGRTLSPAAASFCELLVEQLPQVWRRFLAGPASRRTASAA